MRGQIIYAGLRKQRSKTGNRSRNHKRDGKRKRNAGHIAVFGGIKRKSGVDFKKTENIIVRVNQALIKSLDASRVCVEVISLEELAKSAEAELDEMWSFVQNKKNQRWLWLAIDHDSRKVLAYTFGARKDEVFRELQELLEPFGITMFYTDAWGAYERNIDAENHTVGKENTQRIERKNLTLRTRIKRLARKTICFSKCAKMHDIVIGLVINILEFGLYFGEHFHAFTP